MQTICRAIIMWLGGIPGDAMQVIVEHHQQEAFEAGLQAGAGDAEAYQNTTIGFTAER